ncbi:MAG: hypothetical protein ACLT16_04905 [[Clostridium] innocuum]
MKKFKLKFIKMAAVFIVAAGIWNLSGFIHAASLSVTASASTIYVGDSVTFTVSASGGAGNVSVSGAANGTYWLENSSQSFTVTASTEGTLTVSASGTGRFQYGRRCDGIRLCIRTGCRKTDRDSEKRDTSETGDTKAGGKKAGRKEAVQQCQSGKS